jgi:hypothetical protein
LHPSSLNSHLEGSYDFSELTQFSIFLPPIADTDPLPQQNANRKAQGYGNWSFSYKFDWYYYISAGGQSTTEFGTVTATHLLDKALDTLTVLDDSTLQIDCSISEGDWKVNLDADKQSFWDSFLGGSNEVPDWIKALSVTMPSFVIHYGKFDYFLTTNLLMPTKKLISIDSSIGVQVPGDVYIVGKLVSK